jgi:hypothetical protein
LLCLFTVGGEASEQNPDTSRCYRLLRVGAAGETERPEPGGQRSEGEEKTASSQPITWSVHNRERLQDGTLKRSNGLPIARRDVSASLGNGAYSVEGPLSRCS